MSMLFSDYLSLGDELERENIFDPILDSDSHFFINLQRLKKASTPEFQESYQRINEYFRKIIKLLDRAKSKSEKDICYRQALKMFDFSEVNGICLGYAKGTSGSGFGKLLGSQVISTAYDIVKLGIDDPEFFQLLPLFEDNVGADRLSDMIATLAYEGKAIRFIFDKDIGFHILGTCTIDEDGLFGAAEDIIQNKSQKAERILKLILSGGSLPSGKILDEMKMAGISERTVRTVMKKLGIRAYRKANVWYWEYPEEISSDARLAEGDANGNESYQP
ncbi:MAG: hypothetical protein QM221_07170 [Bacillota bacterium]|nr:hypothetical protein [Bacillota bacterium]